MQHLKRNWKSLILVFALAVLACTWLWHSRGGGTATAMLILQPPGYPPIGEVQRSGLMRVLDEIAMDRDALIALNVNSTQAESELSQARTWYENNQAALAALDLAIAQKADAVRDQEQAIRTGPAQPGQDQALDTARLELAAARQARRDALVPLKTLLALTLSASQNTTWAAVQAGFGQRMPVRMLTLTNTQAKDYGDAWQRYQLERSAADTAEEQATAAANWQAAQNSIFTPEQQQVMTAYYAYLVAASAAVAEAYETVLPPATSGA